MTLKHLNRPIDERDETRPNGQGEGLEMNGPQFCDQVRPDPRKLFQVRWKHNEPGFRFLADR